MRHMCHFISLITAIFVAGPIVAQAADLDRDMTVVVSQTSGNSQVGLTSKSRGELNGFKGYRHYRNGYRKHSDGWWYPDAAFLPGAKADAVVEKSSKQNHNKVDPKAWMIKNHTDFCTAKYKSYKVEDNSYQPFEGPRKQCLSRYFKG